MSDRLNNPKIRSKILESALRGADNDPIIARIEREEEERRQEALRRRWDNVEGGVNSTESRQAEPAPQPQEAPGGFWSSVGNNFQAAKEGIASGSEIGISDLLGGLVNGLRPRGNMGAGGAAFASSPLGQADSASAGFEQEARADREEQLRAAKAAEADINNIGWFGGQTLARAAGGAANPQSASSLIPVIGPGVAAALSYPSAYGDLRFNGASPEEAASGALPSAIAEYAGAKLGNGLSLSLKPLAGTGSRAATRWANETLKEGTGEALTSLMQSGNLAAIGSTTDNVELRKYANLRAAQWGADAWGSFVGGVLLGAGPATPQAMQQYAAEQGALTQKRIQIANDMRRNTEESGKKKPDLNRETIDAGNAWLRNPVGATPTPQLTPERAGLPNLDPNMQAEAEAIALREAQNRAAQLKAPPNNTGRVPVGTNYDSVPLVDPNMERQAASLPPTEPATDPTPSTPEDDNELVPSSVLGDSIRNRGMAQTTADVPDSKTTPLMVVDALAARRGKRDSNIATELLYRNKVKIVDSADQLPEGARQLDTVGWYDGKTTYVVADKLDKDNILPQLMSVMGHEVKHGVDASGFEHVLGKQANNALVKQAINLAKSGDERAVEAFKSATGGSDFTKTLTDREQKELVAYSINNAMDDNKGGTILRTAAAALREKAQAIGLRRSDVKIEDLRYLTKSMLESVATSDKNLAGALPDDGEGGQAMFGGIKAKNAPTDSLAQAMDSLKNGADPEEVRQSTGWMQDTDGQMKFEFSDNNADLMPAWHDLPTKLQDNHGALLGKVLSHDKLFEAYPWTKLLRITRKPYPFRPNVQGHANYDAREINIAPGVSDPVSIILHEVQHMIQARENWAAGGNQNAVLSEMSPEQKLAQVPKLLEPLRKKAEEEAALFNVYDKLSRLPTSMLKSYRDMVDSKEAAWKDLESAKEEYGDDSMEAAEARQRWFNKDRETQAAFGDLSKRVFGNNATFKDSTNLSQASRDWKQLNAVRDTWRDKAMANQQLISKLEAGDIKAIDAAAKQTDATFDFYRRLSGEVQARVTQARQRMTDDQRKETSPMQTRINESEVMPEDEITILQDGTQMSEAESAEAPFKMPRATRDNATHEIVDGQTKKVVDWAIGTSSALRKVDNRDNAYGGYRYQAKRIRENDDPAVPQKPAAGMAQVLTPRDKANAVKDKRSNKPENVLFRAITRGLFGDKNFGRELKEIELNAANRAVSMAVKAEQASYKLQNAIENAAKSSGKTVDEVNAAIDAVINNANKKENMNERRTLISALDRTFPDANIGKYLNDMREMNWQMSLGLIKDRALDPRPLTKKELNTYEKMLDNAERWTTRAYQSQMSGKELYASTFMNRANADANSTEAKQLKAALDTLTEGYIGIPDEKTLQELTTKKLKELYTAWDLGNSRSIAEAPDSRDDLIEKLSFLNTISGEQLNKKAMEIAMDLLGANKQAGGAANMIRGMRQNRTVLEARTKIPHELRDLMGEVKDPHLRLAISSARLTQLVSSTKALNDIYTQGKDSFWSDAKQGGFTQQLSSPTFGPMDGKWVTKDTFDMLGAYTQFNNDFDAEMRDVLEKPGKLAAKVAEKGVAAMQRLSSIAKFSAVVSNMAGGLANFAGSGLTLVKNGVYNPKHIVKGFYDTLAMVTSQKLRNASPERMALNQELLLAGVTDSAQAQEFRSAIWQRVKRALRDDNTDSGMRKALNMLNDRRGAIVELTGEAYAFMDVWSKTATYYANKDFLTKLNKAEGFGWTDEQIIREAGYDTTLSTVSYNRASPLLRSIERNVPFGGTFLVYKGEAIRSTFGGLQVAKRYAQMAVDAKTPEGKLLASKRAMEMLGGTAAATAGIITGTTMLLNNMDDEDKKKRALFPDWEKTKIHVLIGKDEDGREHYASLNRADPIGPLNEPIVGFIMAMQQDKGVGESLVKAIGDFSTTLAVYNNASKLVTDLYGASLGDGASGYQKDTALERAFPTVAEKVKDFAPYANLGSNSLAIADSLIPSQLGVALDPKRLNVKGDGAEAARWLKMIGYKDVVVDPDKALGFRATDYKNGMSKLNKEKSALLKNTTNPDKLLESIYELQDKERELFENLSEATVSYTSFSKPAFFEGKPQDTDAKLTKKDAANALDGRVDKGKLPAIMSGRFEPTIVNDELVDKWLEAQVSKIDRKDPDYKEQMRSAKDTAKLLSRALRAKRSEE